MKAKARFLKVMSAQMMGQELVHIVLDHQVAFENPTKGYMVLSDEGLERLVVRLEVSRDLIQVRFQFPHSLINALNVSHRSTRV